MPLVTALPTPPSRANPATFSADADAFLAALSQFATEVNAVGQAIVIGPMAVAGGTADAITANFTPDISLTNGQTVLIRAGYANATTTPTFSPNGLTAHTIVKGANQALVAGDIAGAGHWLQLQYDSTLTAWVLQNPMDGHSLTVAQFDNSTQNATTAFVRRQGLQFANYSALASSSTLTAADFGKSFTHSGSTAHITTLPLANSAPTGACINFMSTATVNMSIARQGTDQIFPNQSGGLTSLSLGPGDNVTLVSNGVNAWAVVSGSAALPYSSLFGAFLAANGYQKLPGGLILQWGTTGSIASGSGLTFTMPITFPNATLNLSVTRRDSVAGGSASAFYGYIVSASQITVNNGTAISMQGYWFAIGY